MGCGLGTAGLFDLYGLLQALNAVICEVGCFLVAFSKDTLAGCLDIAQASRLAKELPVARAYAWDVGDPAAVELTFESIESGLGSVDVLIYNAGKGVWGFAEEVAFEDFEAAWLTNTFGAFAAARGVIPARSGALPAHYLHRCDRFSPRRRQDGRICFSQGVPAQSCRIPRPFARAIGDPCLADHH
jgi:NAD(P)-dependent dehydrogenase (short-subunit alcohol dehydrogenase family)